ncbi:MAG: formate dehydrogenase accessory sulfurtransferase FdhD [Thermoleophilia bacterium]
MATSAADRSAAVPARVLRLRDGRWETRADRLAGEEPLEVRVAAAGGEATPVAVTMRTPGADFALAAGFLVTEGLLEAGDISGVAYCTDPGEEQAYNAVVVRSANAPRREVRARAHAVTAACGVCGTATLDELRARCAPVACEHRVAARTLLGLPDVLLEHQRGFGRTGALHAAGLFTGDGAAVRVHEDVGRHNAVDKVVGWAALEGRLPLAGHVLLVSGRSSFEIVQKAAVAGIPVVCAVSGPSSLAVATADALGVTLVGFLREDRMNVYTHPQRITRED